MATQVLSENKLFRGDLIVTQSEVIFFKKKKKKKKQATPTRCILLATNNYVAFTQNNKQRTEILGFGTNIITDFTHSQDIDSNSYKLEISVVIKNKSHQLCIEFPTNDAEQQRHKFIQYFTFKTKHHPSCATESFRAQENDSLNNETLRKRARQLSEKKYLATLYKTLVGKSVITADEFWDEYGQETDIETCAAHGLTQGISNTALQSTVQRESWSLFSVFKEDVCNNGYMHMDKNKLTINLTAEKILEIFINLPQVKLAYEQNVPSKYTEVDFWTAFLQSQYFKRETTKNGALALDAEDTEMDQLLKTHALQVENELNEEHLDEDQQSMTDHMELDANEGTNNATESDIEIMDDDANDANKPLKRRRYKKKLKVVDPSVDLAATMQSFTEVIEDPGVEEHKHMKRDHVQQWFNQVNKHGTMILYQSLNQRNNNKNVSQKQDMDEIRTHIPKVHYGRNSVTDVNEDDMKHEDIEMDDNFNAMDLDYDDRLNLEGEFEDLIEDNSNKYIELRIKDQSMYWSESLWLNDAEVAKMNEISVSLHKYLHDAGIKKKKLAELQVKNVSALRFVEKTVYANTENNAAFGSAKLASERMMNNRNREYDEKENLMIFTQNKHIVANGRILEQLLEFQKPMKELVRHYWHCFPADQQRLRKAKIIVHNIKEFQSKLVQFQRSLDKKENMDYCAQKVLLQELIDLAQKVLEHDTIHTTRSQTA